MYRCWPGLDVWMERNRHKFSIYMKNFLTPKEVSKLLKINYNRVLDFIHLGKLSAYKLGKDYRISEGDLFDFLQARKYNSFWKDKLIK